MDATALEARCDDATLVRRHQASVWRFLRWLGCDPALADDLTQDTFVRLLRHRPAGLDGRDPAPWLRQTALNLFRTQRVRARPGVPLDETHAVDAAWQRWLARAADGDANDALADCLRALAPRSRDALDLHYRHGATLPAIAAATDLSVAGVKSLLARARAQLALCIGRRRGTAP